jgi:hypothetical protein
MQDRLAVLKATDAKARVREVLRLLQAATEALHIGRPATAGATSAAVPNGKAGEAGAPAAPPKAMAVCLEFTELPVP